MEDIILSIDNGTQSVRALAFNSQGELLDKVQVKLTDYTAPEPGWMEHDVEGFWQSVCKVCQMLWDQGVVLPSQIAGLVITTQRATVINLDETGTPLRPAIIWPDKRRAESVNKLPLPMKVIFKTLGISDTIQTFEQEAESNWIMQNQPDIWAKTDKFLLLSGYLNYRFTGKMIDAIGNQVGFIPFDFKRQTWCKPGDWKWPALSIKQHMLPDLVSAGELMGGVTEEAAIATGLPMGIPVIAGASDKACEVLGSGGAAEKIGAISCGTTATINYTTKKYIEPQPYLPPFPAALPGYYNMEANVTRGFWMVSWFAEEFGLAERQRALEDKVSPESFFDSLIDTTPPGADGLMLQPFWNPGIRNPGPEARGSIIGFTDTHKRAHVYRAIIEGLAYALREGKERIENRSKSKMTHLCISGGGSQSDAVMQIIADVLNLPAARPALYEASGLGAAILASVGLGIYDDIDTASSIMIRKGKTFTPRPEQVNLYDRLYKDVYAKLYKQVKPIYETLADIHNP